MVQPWAVVAVYVRQVLTVGEITIGFPFIPLLQVYEVGPTPPVPIKDTVFWIQIAVFETVTLPEVGQKTVYRE